MGSTTTENVTEPEETDEDILNVLRRAEKDKLSTREIAEELSIKKRTTGGRLNELKAKGRIEQEEVGQTHVWQLADTELDHPVDPERETLIYWSSKGRQSSQHFQMGGKLFSGSGRHSCLSL